jgi:hypothetical protein
MHQLETLIQAIPPAVFAANGLSNFAAAMNPPDATLSSMASSTHTYPTSVPPPSLNIFPLINPSTHFPSVKSEGSGHNSAFHSLVSPINGSSTSTFKLSPVTSHTIAVEQSSDDTARLSLSPSYLYVDDEGYTRWQGQTSGLPLLDLLVERHSVPSGNPMDSEDVRSPRKSDLNPEMMWRLVTASIAPDLMDR